MTADQIYDLLARVHHLVLKKDTKRKAENQMEVVSEAERQRAIEYFLKKESDIGRPNPEVRRFTSKNFGGRAMLTMLSSQRVAREFMLFLTGLTPASSTRVKAAVWKPSTRTKAWKRGQGGNGGAGNRKRQREEGGEGAGAGWNKDGD